MLDVKLKIFCHIYSSLYVSLKFVRIYPKANDLSYIYRRNTSPLLLTIVNWACLLQHLFPLQISQDTCFTYLLPSTWTVLYFIIILGVPPPSGRFFFSVLRVVKAAIHGDIKHLKCLVQEEVFLPLFLDSKSIFWLVEPIFILFLHKC